MAKPSARSTYARIVGEVAILWNELERRLDSLIFHYFMVDGPVAGFVLGEMGNATKADFAKFLIDRYEDNALLKEHGFHLVALINRLRENRNILEHARPSSYRDQYHGTIYKTNKRGYAVEFGAPIATLQALLRTMELAGPYARWLTFCLHMHTGEEFDGLSGGKKTSEAALQVLASIERPQLPNKLGPLPPP